MSARRTEYPTHTDAQVRDYVTKAAELVLELELRPETEAAALTAAVGLYASKHVAFEQVAPAIANMVVPRGV